MKRRSRLHYLPNVASSLTYFMLILVWGTGCGGGNNDHSALELFERKRIGLTEFADEYFREIEGYSVTLSPGATQVDRESDVSFVVNAKSLHRALMVSSATWNVVFYVDEVTRRIYLCLPEEHVPQWAKNEGVKRVFVPPLPDSPTLLFSEERYMCGTNCLALLAYALGRPVSPEDVANAAGTDFERGTSMAGLADAANGLGLKARGFSMDLEQYKRLTLPVIASVALPEGHFVVLSSYNSDGSFSVIDPPITQLYSEEAFSEIYSGHILVISK